MSQKAETKKIDGTDSRMVSGGTKAYKLARIGYRRLLASPQLGKSFEAEMWLLFDLLQPIQASRNNWQIKLLNGKRYEIDSVFEFEDVVVCIECKDGKTHNISSQVNKIFAEKESIASFLKQAFSFNKSKNIVHILAYKEQDIEDEDFAGAALKKIIIWDQRHLEFYRSIAKKLNADGREIIFSDFLRGYKIFQKKEDWPDSIVALKTVYRLQSSGRDAAPISSKKNIENLDVLQNIEIPCYYFVLSPKILKKISYVNRRGLQHSGSESGGNYQRLIKTSKLKEIKEFVKAGGSFPTSVILNFEGPLGEKNTGKGVYNAGSDSEIVQLSLKKEYGQAIVIDGQHRIFGYSGLPEESAHSTLNVIAFERLPEYEQVKMFVEINEKQTTVDAAVMYDLYTEIFPENNYNHVISKTIKNLNKFSVLADKIYIPSISKYRKAKYPIYINNAGVVLGKLRPLYKNVCSGNGTKFSKIIEAFVATLAAHNAIKNDIGASESFFASNNGFFAILKTLTKFGDFVTPLHPNINEISQAQILAYVKEFGNAIAKGIIGIGIDKLILEKRKSSESSKDDLTNKIISKAAEYNPELKKIAKDIFLALIEEDSTNEFKETLISGRDDKDTDYFEEEILGTICAYINHGQEGSIWVGIDNHGKRVGINKEFEERFQNSFDKLNLYLLDQMKKININGGMSTDRDVVIEKFQENPLILRIKVSSDNQSVAILKMSNGKLFGYDKRMNKKVKITKGNVEQTFVSRERLERYNKLLLDLYREKNGD